MSAMGYSTHKIKEPRIYSTYLGQAAPTEFKILCNGSTPDLKFLTHALFSSLLGKVLESSPQKERPKIVPNLFMKNEDKKDLFT
jgi:hypothetical protein